MKVHKFWKQLNKQAKKGKGDAADSAFLPGLLTDFANRLTTLEAADPSSSDFKLGVRYCERFLEFIVDLLAQLPTRRFFHAVVADRHIAAVCELSCLNQTHKGDAGKLFSQLLVTLRLTGSFAFFYPSNLTLW